MNNKFIITKTNNIEGCTILKYIDSIYANILIRTNILTDIVAGMSDMFSTDSIYYKDKLEKIYIQVKKELQEKAKALGANAIIGFAVDFDEISGGGKSMLMISASGTACIIENKLESKVFVDNIIPSTIVSLEIKKKEIINRIKKGEDIDGDLSDFLLDYPLQEVARYVMNAFVNKFTYNDEFMDFSCRYFSSLPVDFATKYLYSVYSENNSRAIGWLLTKCKRFSPLETLNLFERLPLKYITYILLVDKIEYTHDDLKYMLQIYEKFNSLPNIGKIELVKGGIFSKEKEMFICSCGHTNEKERKFCSSCGVNIQGLSEQDLEIIDKFKAKIEIIKGFIEES